MSTKSIHDKRRVAIHEAGHAIMNIVLDRKIESVSISDKTGLWAGRCTAEELLYVNNKEKTVRRSMKVALAGLLAEKVSGYDMDLTDSGYSMDWNEAIAKAKSFVPEIEVNEYIAFVMHEAESTLKNSVIALSRLADALVEKEQLSGLEVHKIVYPEK
jgi:ATP-dependent Zn protease